MRRFVLWRHEDVSGVSGTGMVAEGVEFSDGRVVLRWRGSHPSFTLFKSVQDLVAVHGHQGRTEVQWVDA